MNTTSRGLPGRTSTWRHRLLLLLLLVVTVSVSVQVPALAQEDEGPELGVQGTFINPGDDGPSPVEGVRVEVTDADGNVVGEATSDAEGTWLVEVPEVGDYTVTVDLESFPEGVSLRNPDEPSRTLRVNPGQVRPMLFPLGEGTGAASGGADGFDTRRFLQLSVEGVKLGLLIAMMAIGLSLVYGTTQLVNFAHGELITLGAIIAFLFNVYVGMPLIAAAVIAIAATALVGGLLDLGIFRPLRERGVGLIAQLVITIGLSLLLRYALLYLFRGDPRSYADYNIQRGIPMGPILLTPKDLWSIGLSIAILLAIGLLLQKTKIGRAMRAVSDNRDLAESSGIDVQRVILLVWTVGAGLAAFGGILWGVGESVSWIMGFRLLLPIFAGVILGGIGTAYGALVGSLVVGIFIQTSTLVIPSELKNAAAMVVLVIILVIRPQGILGRSERIG